MKVTAVEAAMAAVAVVNVKVLLELAHDADVTEVEPKPDSGTTDGELGIPVPKEPTVTVTTEPIAMLAVSVKPTVNVVVDIDTAESEIVPVTAEIVPSKANAVAATALGDPLVLTVTVDEPTEGFVETAIVNVTAVLAATEAVSTVNVNVVVDDAYEIEPNVVVPHPDVGSTVGPAGMLEPNVGVTTVTTLPVAMGALSEKPIVSVVDVSAGIALLMADVTPETVPAKTSPDEEVAAVVDTDVYTCG